LSIRASSRVTSSTISPSMVRLASNATRISRIAASRVGSDGDP